jgi:glucose-6-phosphate 1-dehydrogenase
MQSIAMPTRIDVSKSLPDALVVLGASGDLAKRMIWPSLFHLHRA